MEAKVRQVMNWARENRSGPITESILRRDGCKAHGLYDPKREPKKGPWAL